MRAILTATYAAIVPKERCWAVSQPAFSDHLKQADWMSYLIAKIVTEAASSKLTTTTGHLDLQMINA